MARYQRSITAEATGASSGGGVVQVQNVAAPSTAESANTVQAGPASGAAALPSYRALVAADIPALDAAKVTTGTLAASLLPAATGAALGAVKVATDPGAPSFVSVADAQTWCATLRTNLLSAGIIG